MTAPKKGIRLRLASLHRRLTLLETQADALVEEGALIAEDLRTELRQEFLDLGILPKN